MINNQYRDVNIDMFQCCLLYSIFNHDVYKLDNNNNIVKYKFDKKIILNSESLNSEKKLSMASYFNTYGVSKKYLNTFCQNFNIYIRLRVKNKKDNESRVIEYGNYTKCSHRFYLCCVNKHYFIDCELPISTFYLNNYDSIEKLTNTQNYESRFQAIEWKDSSKKTSYKVDIKKYTRSYDIVITLLKNNNLLTRIDSENRFKYMLSFNKYKDKNYISTLNYELTCVRPVNYKVDKQPIYNCFYEDFNKDTDKILYNYSEIMKISKEHDVKLLNNKNEIDKKELYKVINNNYDKIHELNYKEQNVLYDCRDFVTKVNNENINYNKKHQTIVFADFETLLFKVKVSENKFRYIHVEKSISFKIHNDNLILTENEIKNFQQNESFKYVETDFNKDQLSGDKDYLLEDEVDKIVNKSCSEKMLYYICDLLKEIDRIYYQETKTKKERCIKFYFHNLKFDLCFIIKKQYNISIINKGNCVYSVTGYFGPVKDSYKIKLCDSFKLIAAPLSKFSQMFNFESVKEIMDYNFYDYNVVFNPIMDVDTIFKKSTIFNNNYEAFLNNCKKIKILYDIDGVKYVDMNKYNAYYNKMDVLVLFKGMMLFRNYFKLIEPNVDPLQCLTVSALADKQMKY